MRRALPVAAWLIASATAADVAPRPLVAVDACTSDRECVISAFECCGGCCPRGPRAMHVSELKRQQNRCAVIECERRNCPEVKCAVAEPESAFKAVCRQNACVAERVSVRAECTTNAECAITYPTPACTNPGPCGCCPGTQPVAVPVMELERVPSRAEPQPTPPPQAPKKGEVKYGLSQGGPERTPVNCSPCPGPRPATAMCSAGKCVVAPPVTRPRPPG